MRQELTGKKYQMLTVLSRSSKQTEHGDRYWLCKCECGKSTELTTYKLLTRKIKSCGCMRGAPNPDPEYAIKNEIYGRYKYQAKKRGYSFSLGKEIFHKLIKGNCYYCGNTLSNSMIGQSGRIIKYNGIDRKNNNIGYTVKNCVSCCSDCNYIKMNFSEKEFLKIIKRIYEFQIEGNK